MSTIAIPFLIGGEFINREETLINRKFQNKETKISLPKLYHKDFEKVENTKKQREALHELSTEEIISFLVKVKENWKRGSEHREVAQRLAEETIGYSSEMVNFALQQIEEVLSEDYLNLLMNCELGDKRYVDEWIKNGEAYVHAQPKGTVLHVMAGNAPLISVISFLRGILTKNINLFKMASDDLITLPLFMQALIKVDPEHPITKSTSVVYWEGSNLEIFREFVTISDILCVWGGGDAVQTTREHSTGKEIMEFGPRRGIQLIGKEVFFDKSLMMDVAKRAAHDVIIFDQEACFSPQICFVEANKEQAKDYGKILEQAIVEASMHLPKGFKTLQHSAAIGHTKTYSTFLGNEVIDSKKNGHMIIITEKIKHTKSHPLGRTIYIIPVGQFDDVLDEIGHETQVVAIEPYARASSLREKITRNGVDRITQIGKMPYFAAGAPHEGMYPLGRLVRWVHKVGDSFE